MGFATLVDDLKSTTKRGEKEFYLETQTDDFAKYLFQEALDPDKLHNVRLTKKSIPPIRGDFTLEDIEEDVRDLFDVLGSSFSSKVNKMMVVALMRRLTREDQEALLSVVNKKLKVGVGIRAFNKVFPGSIVVYPIQLAHKYSPKKNYPNDSWYHSLKYDGVRIFVFRVKDSWHIYSRSKDYLGKELFTLDHWKLPLEKIYRKYGLTYFEGEAYHEGWEFSAIQSLVFSTVNLKDKAQELMFYCFLAGYCNDEIRCDENLTELDIPASGFGDVDSIVAVYQSLIANNPLDIIHYLDRAMEIGSEGIMLRNADCLYSPKRDNNLLKVKPSYFKNLVDKWDCEILDVEFDYFTIQEGGIISSEYLPVRLIVLQPDGVECKVGSGFKLSFRRWLATHCEEVISKTAEIEHCGLGSKGRMRFPVYKRLREDV